MRQLTSLDAQFLALENPRVVVARTFSKIAALAASMVALAVIVSGPAVADPFATGSLVPVSGASPIAACEGDTGFRDVGGVPANQFVNSEAIVPTPSVNANPFTFAVASANRMNAVIRVITFASMIVAIPRL
jgi:hypothetical protein